MKGELGQFKRRVTLAGHRHPAHLWVDGIQLLAGLRPEGFEVRGAGESWANLTFHETHTTAREVAGAVAALLYSKRDACRTGRPDPILSGTPRGGAPAGRRRLDCARAGTRSDSHVTA